MPGGRNKGENESGEEFDPSKRYDPETLARIAYGDRQTYPESRGWRQQVESMFSGQMQSHVVAEKSPAKCREQRRWIRQWIVLPLTTLCALVLFAFGTKASFFNEILTPKPLDMSLSYSDDYGKCSIEKLELNENWDICENVCNSAECCSIPSTDKRSCFKEYEKVCEKYSLYCSGTDKGPGLSEGSIAVAPASELKNTNDPPEAPKDREISTLIHHACDNGTLSTQGWAPCEELCDPAACCFEDECPKTLKINCMEYEMCFFFYKEKIKTLDDKNKVEEPTPSSTAVTVTTDQGEMQNFITNEDKIFLVSQFCTKELIYNSDMDRKACEDLCEERSCCFASTATNCFDSHEAWCNEYNLCQVLATSEDEQESGVETKDNVGELASIDGDRI